MAPNILKIDKIVITSNEKKMLIFQGNVLGDGD